MATIYYGAVLLVSMYCLADWRRGLYLCLIIDAIRDPLRKMTEGHPVAMTVIGVAPWGAIFLGALIKERAAAAGLWRRYPMVRNMVYCLLCALVPAGVLASILYRSGYLLAAVGSASYLVPLLGMTVGYLLARSEKDVLSLLRFYVLVNAIMLISVPLEYLKFDVPALGGIDVVWVRYHGNSVVALMCGWYRSPDVMGMHAAHVLLFSGILLLRSATPTTRTAYGLIGLWSTVGLLLCGRRKMIGMPIIFVVTYVLLCQWRGISKASGKLVGLVCVCLILATGLLMTQEEAEQGNEYTDYAMTLVTESSERANKTFIGHTATTLRQAGILGNGLGSATQGRHYLGIKTTADARGWQEDGLSRLFAELGIPGVIFVVVAGVQALLSLVYALKLIPPHHPAQTLQIGLLGTIAADLVSYMFSHQLFSGDPASAILVTVMFGAVLGAPRIYAQSMQQAAAARNVRPRSRFPSAASRGLGQRPPLPEGRRG
ncbi:MAG: hypothetical protein KF774_04590 [Planctomyces sp.]|nr:hypothetical protein [Planctomyces sp.]